MVGQTFTSMLVDDIDDAEDDGNSDDDVSLAVLAGRGVKRKRAPCTKGPCEHGVKYRSKCKVCSKCEHGRTRYACKECGGSQICEHGRVRSKCKECGGGAICEHGRRRSQCKECGGGSMCEHGRQRSQCKAVSYTHLTLPTNREV